MKPVLPKSRYGATLMPGGGMGSQFVAAAGLVIGLTLAANAWASGAGCPSRIKDPTRWMDGARAAVNQAAGSVGSCPSNPKTPKDDEESKARASAANRNMNRMAKSMAKSLREITECVNHEADAIKSGKGVTDPRTGSETSLDQISAHVNAARELYAKKKRMLFGATGRSQTGQGLIAEVEKQLRGELAQIPLSQHEPIQKFILEGDVNFKESGGSYRKMVADFSKKLEEKEKHFKHLEDEAEACSHEDDGAYASDDSEMSELLNTMATDEKKKTKVKGMIKDLGLKADEQADLECLVYQRYNAGPTRVAYTATGLTLAGGGGGLALKGAGVAARGLGSARTAAAVVGAAHKVETSLGWAGYITSAVNDLPSAYSACVGRFKNEMDAKALSEMSCDAVHGEDMKMRECLSKVAATAGRFNGRIDIGATANDVGEKFLPQSYEPQSRGPAVQ